MERQAYDSDLTDAEWERFEQKLKEVQDRRGRKSRIPRREIVNAILYRLRTGCQWRSLPHEFPGWNNVAKTYRRWVMNGYWERIHDALCRDVRKKTDEKRSPALSSSTRSPSRPTRGPKSRATTAGKKSRG